MSHVLRNLLDHVVRTRDKNGGFTTLDLEDGLLLTGEVRLSMTRETRRGKETYVSVTLTTQEARRLAYLLMLAVNEVPPL